MIVISHRISKENGRKAVDIHTRRVLGAGTRGGWLFLRPIEACPCEGSYLQGPCELSSGVDNYHYSSRAASFESSNLGMRQTMDLVASFDVYQRSPIVSQLPLLMRASATTKARYAATHRLKATRASTSCLSHWRKTHTW